MINGNIGQFLDTGWYNKAALYYNGHVYRCEGDTDFTTGNTRFWVTRWRAYQDNNNIYHTVIGKDGEPLDYDKVLDISDNDLDQLKKSFCKLSF